MAEQTMSAEFSSSWAATLVTVLPATAASAHGEKSQRASCACAPSGGPRRLHPRHRDARRDGHGHGEVQDHGRLAVQPGQGPAQHLLHEHDRARPDDHPQGAHHQRRVDADPHRLHQGTGLRLLDDLRRPPGRPLARAPGLRRQGRRDPDRPGGLDQRQGEPGRLRHPGHPAGRQDRQPRELPAAVHLDLAHPDLRHRHGLDDLLDGAQAHHPPPGRTSQIPLNRRGPVRPDHQEGPPQLDHHDAGHGGAAGAGWIYQVANSR